MELSKANKITEQIIGASFAVSNELGAGFVEKVYENALFIELQNSHLTVFKQKPLQVFYQQQVVGTFYADIIVENEIIVELKAVSAINEVHQAQLMNYLKACNQRYGLIINFGTPKVTVKRMLNGY